MLQRIACLMAVLTLASALSPSNKRDWMSDSFNNLGEWMNSQFQQGMDSFDEGMKEFSGGLKTAKNSMLEINDELKRGNVSEDNLAMVLFGNNTEAGMRYNLGGCSCMNYTCGCCARISVPKVNLNNSACLNITYISEDIGVQLTFDIDGKVLYNQTVSVKNPPPICADIPYLKEAASVCVKLYKMDIGRNSLSGCADLIAKLAEVEVARIKIGCFRLAKGSKYFEQSVVSVEENNKTSKFVNEFSQQSGHEFNVKSVSIMESNSDLPSVSWRKLPSKSLSNNWSSFILNRRKRVEEEHILS